MKLVLSCLAALLLPLSALAFDYSKIPKCEGTPTLEIPALMQGTYVRQRLAIRNGQRVEELYSITVDNRGVRADSNVFSYYNERDKRDSVLDEAYYVRQGYCLEQSLEPGPAGETILQTSFVLNTLGKSLIGTRIRNELSLSFDPATNAFYDKWTSTALTFLIIIPAPGADWTNWTEIAKVSDTVTPRAE